jgi:Ca2+-binding EF-hand superfamily protein
VTGCDGVKLKPKIKIHPVIKLRNFVEKNNIKLIDIFNKFDKDGSMTVTQDEFKQGLQVGQRVLFIFFVATQLTSIYTQKNKLFSTQSLGINLSEEELKQLMLELDSDRDGEINYR